MMITSTSASSLAFGVITLAALSSSVYILLKKCKELKDLQHKYEREMDLRKTERAGRTTAERRLRKELAALIKGQTDGGLIFRPVARAKTPFKGRCGTPRQGQLAPNVKGQLIFETGVSPVSLDSLDQFSHLWVIFLFHQNTNWTESTCSGKKRFTFTAKIAPPRLFGKRVGVFSTRSPHRPNPIGLTVVRIDSVDVVKGIIHISGVDICDGTPVLDVKPYIHFDVVGPNDLRVPHWVTDVDIPKWELLIEPEAEEGLRQLVQERSSLFYPTYEAMVSLLRDVLLQDVRSVHQGRGSTKKEANLEEDTPYRCNIDDIAIEFHTMTDAIRIVRAYEDIKDAIVGGESGLEAEEDNRDSESKITES